MRSAHASRGTRGHAARKHTARPSGGLMTHCPRVSAFRRLRFTVRKSWELRNWRLMTFHRFKGARKEPTVTPRWWFRPNASADDADAVRLSVRVKLFAMPLVTER